MLLTSRLQKITYSTVTSIATLLTFFVFYKYVRYSAIQYLKQYWLKSDQTNNYILKEKKRKKQKSVYCQSALLTIYRKEGSLKENKKVQEKRIQTSNYM